MMSVTARATVHCLVPLEDALVSKWCYAHARFIDHDAAAPEAGMIPIGTV